MNQKMIQVAINPEIFTYDQRGAFTEDHTKCIIINNVVIRNNTGIHVLLGSADILIDDIKHNIVSIKKDDLGNIEYYLANNLVGLDKVVFEVSTGKYVVYNTNTNCIQKVYQQGHKEKCLGPRWILISDPQGNTATIGLYYPLFDVQNSTILFGATNEWKFLADSATDTDELFDQEPTQIIWGHNFVKFIRDHHYLEIHLTESGEPTLVDIDNIIYEVIDHQ